MTRLLDKLLLIVSCALTLTIIFMGTAPAADMSTKAQPARDPAVVYRGWEGWYGFGYVGGAQTRGSLTRDASIEKSQPDFCKKEYSNQEEWKKYQYLSYLCKVLTTTESYSGGTVDDNVIGLMIGGGLGFNMKTAQNWYVGLEADGSWTGARGYLQYGDVQAAHRIPFLGNVSARVIYLVTPVVGVYAKGGLALAQFNTDITGGAIASEHKFKAGWGIGGGLEWLVTQSTSVRVEGMFNKFSDQNVAFSGGSSTLRGEVVTVKAALSRYFN